MDTRGITAVIIVLYLKIDGVSTHAIPILTSRGAHARCVLVILSGRTLVKL